MLLKVTASFVWLLALLQLAGTHKHYANKSLNITSSLEYFPAHTSSRCHLITAFVFVVLIEGSAAAKVYILCVEATCELKYRMGLFYKRFLRSIHVLSL